MKKEKKSSPTRKLVAAIALLALSTCSLFGSTYAWFTMNKTVTVTGMELKAHSEEGLLINEVKLATSNTWDDAAQAAATPTTFELRPTSTSDLATWWHANSKKSADEAGVDALADTVKVNDNDYYVNLSSAIDQTIIGAEGAASGEKATGNTQAETHVFYTDASYGTSGSYQNGEGYYVRYTYYLKSSGQNDFGVTDLQAMVKATKKNSDGATDSTKLDPALRVGIAVPANNSSSTIVGRAIFAPIPGTGSTAPDATNTTYNVTNNVTGSATTTVTPVVASATGTYTAYQTLNLTSGEPAAAQTITIPKVTSDGIPVYVYVWFEGEDTHCMSDNLTAVLDTYDIDITFNINSIGGAGTSAGG